MGSAGATFNTAKYVNLGVLTRCYQVLDASSNTLPFMHALQSLLHLQKETSSPVFISTQIDTIVDWNVMSAWCHVMTA